MISILPFIVVLAVLLSLAVFFWIWWVAPKDQVPPHLTELELRRLEVQDRLRQTNYQILTALGLGATFIATVFQLALTSRQWSQDYQFKISQERLGHYSDALKAIGQEGAPQIAGIGSLYNLALQDPAGYHFQVNDVLSALVKKNADKSPMSISLECNGPGHELESRSEARAEVQAAMTVLGNRRFASYRARVLNGACETGGDLANLRLDHLYLDELDLGERDFSCASLTQTKLHIVNFRGAWLRGTDFSGARFADFETPLFPEADIADKLYTDEKKGGPPDWKKYRCWVTDFRYADLTGAKFEGAALDGADFGGADLTKANLCRADVSRANFTKAKGLTSEMIKESCVGKSSNDGSTDVTAQPFGLSELFGKEFMIQRCPTNKSCP